MRVVLDTNVIVSAVLFGGVPEAAVVKILGGDHQLVLSPYIVEETNRILAGRFGVDPLYIELLNELLKVAEMQYFQPFLDVVADQPDNRIIETAVKGRASIIVTGDKQLLKLGTYKDTYITTPALMLQALRITLQ